MLDSLSENNTFQRNSLGNPQIIFFCDLPSSELEPLLARPGVLTELATQGYGVALALRHLDASTAELVRTLNAQRIPTIAWLLLPPSEGVWLNVQNYPQVIERYQAFRMWVQANTLHFDGVGLDIEPPSAELDRLQRWGLPDLVRRIWLAHENVLFLPARAAYIELIAHIHHDGYEVHTYQLPILADDRRAGTTLVQRVLDIVDLPADLEVLICYSSAPLDKLNHDLGGALITSYGPSADSIGVGIVSPSPRESSEELPPLAWEALERDLILAARHTDMIYIYSLEGCVERGLLPRLATINWDAPEQAVTWKVALVSSLRSAILSGLLFARFSPNLFAWLGWGLFALMLAQRIRDLLQTPEERP
ncbi:hypothetical protein [Candidatus Viridilinea mediisalina]|uniref:Uncharacterized protein n=1 Tax=Candidatus Viridilinea mediisalina TaxID=2024553 RepID=A0A2A6RKR4_9CHLR|nr:hypothetical protein [Candidatus Viridilinea mediisalina]PDW03632.1 hypothetical protein CJ255_07755 [Candidatus Viridilinea mediisalina]